MPGFEARLTDPTLRVPLLASVQSPPLNLTIAEWIDDRAPAKSGLQLRHFVAGRGREIRAICKIPEFDHEAPTETELDGGRFEWQWLEAPMPQPSIERVAGKTSHVRFTPTAIGHYAVLAQYYLASGRSQGGVIMHFDVLS
jgi:hypothetical protein